MDGARWRTGGKKNTGQGDVLGTLLILVKIRFKNPNPRIAVGVLRNGVAKEILHTNPLIRRAE